MEEIKQILAKNNISYDIEKYEDDMGGIFYRGCFAENKEPLFDIPGESEEVVFKSAYSLAKKMRLLVL